MIGVRASERKKRAELFEISADFSAFLTKFQHFSAQISALLCKDFALNFSKIERFSALFLITFGNLLDPVFIKFVTLSTCVWLSKKIVIDFTGFRYQRVQAENSTIITHSLRNFSTFLTKKNQQKLYKILALKISNKSYIILSLLKKRYFTF